MTNFAEIDKDGNVLRVIVADHEFIMTGVLGDPANWIETSEDPALRKNHAGIGYKYDKERDAFIPPKPYNSWVLDEAIADWKAPKELPDTKPHTWNEEKLEWEEVKFEVNDAVEEI